MVSGTLRSYDERMGSNEDENRVLFQVFPGSNSRNISEHRTIQYSTVLVSRKSGNVLLSTH